MQTTLGLPCWFFTRDWSQDLHFNLQDRPSRKKGTPGFEPGTCWSAVSRSNHWAMYPTDTSPKYMLWCAMTDITEWQPTQLLWPCGLMDKALVFGTKDCRFESCQGQVLLMTNEGCFNILVQNTHQTQTWPRRKDGGDFELMGGGYKQQARGKG